MQNIVITGPQRGPYLTRLAGELAVRRTQLLDSLPDNSVVVYPAAALKLRNGDCHYTYRQSSEVLYLTGFNEPGAVVVMSKLAGVKAFTMFVQPRDPAQEVWHGARLGPDGAVSSLGADTAYSTKSLSTVLKGMLQKAGQLYLTKGVDSIVEARVREVAMQTGISPYRVRQASALMGDQRLIKSPLEIGLMQTSATIGAHAHNAALMQCHPGISESELKAYIEHVFAVNGASAPAYDSIVAAGKNGLTLHYPAGEAICQDGEMVLIDAGCEYGGYASDITRTLPVNGKFSAHQLDIYKLVLDAQMQCINAVRVGATWTELNDLADLTILQGLERLGFDIVKSKSKSKGRLTLDDVYPHGVGHWLGIDVHDVGDKTVVVDKVSQPRRFKPGMVLTVEPGLYLSTSDIRIPERYRGIAVRIEDDVLVTADGPVVLTANAFKTPEDIEQMMASAKLSHRESGSFTPVVTAKLSL